MAETPELRRIAENTKIQSNIKYHADFEKSKGKFTQVADDPEILRIKQNSKIISNVVYHGELQRKAEMEQKRVINENGFKESSDKANANPAPAPAPVVQTAHVAPIGNPNSIGKISDYDPQVCVAKPVVFNLFWLWHTSNDFKIVWHTKSNSL